MTNMHGVPITSKMELGSKVGVEYLPMYLRDFGDEPSFGNLHFSTNLDRKETTDYGTYHITVPKNTQDFHAYLVVGPSQFLAFPSFTE